jgi:single-strand DNA-binding protein
MAQDNQITLRGFVTAEPKLRQTVATETPYTEIRVGSTPRRLNRETGEWEDLPTSYFTVKCWRRLAVNASSSLGKGDMVVVRGRFYTHRWTDSQQQPRERVEIEADSVGHDLAYGWSHFLRGTHSRAGGRAALEAGEAARQDLETPDDAGDDGYPAGDDGGEADGTADVTITDGADDPAGPGGPREESGWLRDGGQPLPDVVAL